MIVGLDANIICFAVDSAYPEHEKLADLLLDLSPENMVAVNPTTLHEAYHALVFSQKWVPEDAANRLKTLLWHPYVAFFNQTKKHCNLGLRLSVQHKLGGRDALIVANFLSNKVPVIYTHDDELLKLKRITWKNSHITFQDPVTKTK